MQNRVLYIALRLAASVMPRIPLGVAYRLSELAAVLYYLLFPRSRQGILANLTVAFPDSNAGQRQSTARAAFVNNARNWVDTLRIPRLTREQIVDLVDVDGWEHLERAHAAGRGVLLVSMHLGNFDLVGQLLAARGLTVTVPVERVEPPELLSFLTAQREGQGIRTVTLERAPRRMVEALRRGEVVAVTADRLLAGKSLEVEFFGHRTPLSRGLASLARHTGVPVIFGVGVRQGSTSYQGHVASPLVCAHSNDAIEDERALLQEIARHMEDMVRRYPGQWIAFNAIWRQDVRGDVPATMERQSESAG